MQFNDTSTKTGLIQDCEDLLGFDDTDISGNSDLLYRFTKNINAWYRKVNSKIWQATGTWEYDDSNYSNLPIATTDLVNGQGDYELPSSAQKIDRMEVLNSNNDYEHISPMDKSTVNRSMTEFKETDGMPEYYDMVGRSIILYPEPASANIVATNGLKVYFSRDIDEFVSTNTDRTPGFNEDYHRVLSLGASMDYAIGHGMNDKVTILRSELDRTILDLQEFYGYRHRDLKPKIIPHSFKDTHI